MSTAKISRSTSRARRRISAPRSRSRGSSSAQAPDCIVSITTPASQAVVAATKDIPIIFSTVTDPDQAPSSCRPTNIPAAMRAAFPTSCRPPQQIDLVKELVPNLKTLGILYDSAQDSARSTADSIKELWRRRWVSRSSKRPQWASTTSLAPPKVWSARSTRSSFPNDTTVYATFEAVVKVAQDAQVPLFSAERRSVQRGAIGTVGYDFFNYRQADGGNGRRRLSRARSPETWMSSTCRTCPNGLSALSQQGIGGKDGRHHPEESLLDKAAQVF